MNIIKRILIAVAISSVVLTGGYLGLDRAQAARSAAECSCCTCIDCTCTNCACCDCGDACACGDS